MKAINKVSIDPKKVLKITLKILIFAPSLIIFIMFAFAINWHDISYLKLTIPNIFNLLVENTIDYLGKLF